MQQSSTDPQWNVGPVQWESRRAADAASYTLLNSTEPATDGAPNRIRTAARLYSADNESRSAADTCNDLSTSQRNPEAVVYGESPKGESYLGRSEYIGGDVPIDEQQAKSYPAAHTGNLCDSDVKRLQLEHAFDLPPRAVRQGLIDSFMTFCYPWTPVVEREWLEEGHTRESSVLLLQAVFLAGSRVSSAPGITAYASPMDFYRRAKMLFWSGYETNPITLITAVCLLQWYNPDGPEHVSIDTSSFWLRIGVGLAHQVGLHKEPIQSNHAPLRRRLWWSLFVSSPNSASVQHKRHCQRLSPVLAMNCIHIHI